MKVPKETICCFCKQIFCCEKCCKKHEKKTHGILIKAKNKIDKRSSSTKIGEVADSLYVFCPICLNKPFLLRHEEIQPEILRHIEKNHLPLHCKKCAKMYTKIEELREFSKCFNPEKESCVSEGEAQYVSTLQKPNKTCEPMGQNNISTQTSPMLVGESHKISVINHRHNALTNTKTTTQESSFSPLKNWSLTAISSSYNRRSIGITFHNDADVKLVRTTSTPVHGLLRLSKPNKEQTFNASGGQVSSIYSSGGETEVDKNTPISIERVDRPANVFAAPSQGESVGRYRKFCGRSKFAAVTPLRQVMSKSIQKAFAEHGMPHSAEKLKHEITEAHSNSPLDLRLSPALRRSKSDLSSNSIKSKTAYPTAFTTTSTSKPTPENVYPSELITSFNPKKLQSCEIVDESLNSDSTVNSTSSSLVYKTCHSVQIIHTTEISEIVINDNNLGSTEENDQLCPLTKKVYHQKSPRNIVTPVKRALGLNVNKKAIKFETPNVNNDSNCENYYTPCGTPVDCSKVSPSLTANPTVKHEHGRFSPKCRPSIHECAQSTAYNHHEINADSSDEVFLTPKTESLKKVKTSDQATQHGNGFIWSFMGSVIKKGTRFLDKKGLSFDEDAKVKNPIIKRSNSMTDDHFAGA